MIGPSLSLHAIPGIPLIKPGDDLAGIITQSISAAGGALQNGDIIAIAQKIVSKAEGRIVDLATITPSQEAIALAIKTNKDPRQVELILSESKEVMRYKPGVIIVEHHSGVVLANAGIDRSNAGETGGKELVTLLPQDPNAAAKRLRQDIQALSGKQIGIIITDSIGRPWRMGTTGVAIGSAGIQVLHDLRGNKDLFGRELLISVTADADSLASAACLLMGEGNDATPVILVRGFRTVSSDQDARRLLRPKDEDMFR